MAHHLYVTPGFVLDTKNSGEANKLLYIFTRDLGLVMAAAQSVRHLKSKLRFHTQPLCFSEFSLVRGKEIWRLTGAGELKESEAAFYTAIKKNKRHLMLCAQLFALLKRLLHGEEANPELFKILIDGFTFISTEKSFESARANELLAAFENILVLRILSLLGYISPKGAAATFIENNSWNLELLDAASLVRRRLVDEINNALKASHL